MRARESDAAGQFWRLVKQQMAEFGEQQLQEKKISFRWHMPNTNEILEDF